MAPPNAPFRGRRRVNGGHAESATHGVRLPSPRLRSRRHARDPARLRAPDGDARLRLALGQRPRRDPVANHVEVPVQETGDFPLPPTTNFLEPLTALALVAGATARIRLGTTVLVLPHRHPVLAAKMLATLDHLAPGRVILGAGVGWMREEIELFGVAFEQRGA